MVQAATHSTPAKLGRLLVEDGELEPGKLRRALEMQRRLGGHLGTALLELGAVSEQRLLSALGRQRAAPTVDAEDLARVSPDLLKLVPAKLAARHQVVPFRKHGRTLHLASIEPGEVLVEDEIAMLTSCLARTFVGLEVRVLEALDRYYGVERGNRYVHLSERLREAKPLTEEPKEPSRELHLDESLLAEAKGAGLTPKPPASQAVQPAQPASVSPIDALLEPTPSDDQSISIARVRRLLDETPGAEVEPEESGFFDFDQESRTLPLAELHEEIAARSRSEASPSLRPAGQPRSAPTAPASDLDREVEARREPTSSLAAACTALQSPEIRDDIADAVLRFCEAHFRRAVLLMNRRDRVLGWRGRGRGVDVEALRNFSLPIEEPSVLSPLRLGTGVWLGPIAAQQAGNRRLLRLLMGIVPRECLVLPIRLRGRVVAFLYLDNRAGDLASSPIDDAGKLARMAGIGFELYLLRNKLRQLAG